MLAVVAWRPVQVFAFYIGEGVHCDVFRAVQDVLLNSTELLHELVQVPTEIMLRLSSRVQVPAEALTSHQQRIVDAAADSEKVMAQLIRTAGSSAV